MDVTIRDGDECIEPCATQIPSWALSHIGSNALKSWHMWCVHVLYGGFSWFHHVVWFIFLRLSHKIHGCDPYALSSWNTYRTQFSYGNQSCMDNRMQIERRTNVIKVLTPIQRDFPLFSWEGSTLLFHQSDPHVVDEAVRVQAILKSFLAPFLCRWLNHSWFVHLRTFPLFATWHKWHYVPFHCNICFSIKTSISLYSGQSLWDTDGWRSLIIVINGRNVFPRPLIDWHNNRWEWR